MDDSRPPAGADFAAVADALRALTFRDDFVVREIAAPASLAPDAIAFAGDVRPSDDDVDSDYGTGRFVLLHDDEEPDQWGGRWRIVCFAQAPLEPEIGTDPLLADVAWSWLVDALQSRGASFHSASGTATKTLSKGFGTLAEEGDGAQIELRASWSPAGDLAAHRAIGFSFDAQAPAPWKFRDVATGQPQLAWISNSNEVDIAAAEAGLGLTRCLAYQAAAGLRAGRLRIVLADHEPPPVPVHVVYPAGRRAPAKVRAFVEFARERLAKEPVLQGRGLAPSRRP